MVPRLIGTVALAVTLLVLTGCAERIADVRCGDIEAEVVDMEKGTLLKIISANVVRRSPTELTCQGIGIYSDNREILIRYRAYIDEDREIMVSFDTDEAEAVENAQEQRETDAELERVTSAFNKMVDSADAGFE